METTLIINPGSTSKKYALYKDGACVFTMKFEHTGEGFGVCREIKGQAQLCENIPALRYKESLSHCIGVLIREQLLTQKEDITHIGIRVVAPGGFFRSHRVVDENYLSALKKTARLAPLHIPQIYEEMETVRRELPLAVFVAVSDSAFHQSIPEERRVISIRSQDAHDYGIYRFGYHGLSVASIARRLEIFFGILPERVVVGHIGGGVSLTGLYMGRSVDTTMGYSPASGVLMGTRAGDLDADALASLILQKNLKQDELNTYIHTEGGFKGIAGVSDLRMVMNRAASGEAEAKQALQVFRYQFQRQVGALSATLGGLDAIVLTATAAVRNPKVRELLLDEFGFMGIVLDKKKNEQLINSEGMIHDDTSGVYLGVLKTDEMSEMNREVEKMCSSISS